MNRSLILAYLLIPITIVVIIHVLVRWWDKW